MVLRLSHVGHFHLGIIISVCGEQDTAYHQEEAVQQGLGRLVRVRGSHDLDLPYSPGAGSPLMHGSPQEDGEWRCGGGYQVTYWL